MALSPGTRLGFLRVSVAVQKGTISADQWLPQICF